MKVSIKKFAYQRTKRHNVLYCISSTSNNIKSKEQHGCQSIPAFDYYMAPGVVKTFKKQLKQTMDDMLAYTDLDKFVAINGIEREIEKIETIDFDISIFNKYSRESETGTKNF